MDLSDAEMEELLDFAGLSTQEAPTQDHNQQISHDLSFRCNSLPGEAFKRTVM
jgi:hypothetical protein